MNTEKSKNLFEESCRLMPGGVNSPVRAFRAVDRHPLFIDHAEGGHITDVDGNEYIDYVCSWGPGILGHSHPKVIEAVKKACDRGLTYGAPTKKESELALLIMECYPAMEKLRLVSSGTEAVMSAVRAARGYTGRNHILKFTGCYHGHSDGLLVRAGSGLLTHATPDSAGIPGGYTQTTLLADYNNEDAVKQLFQKYPDDIACIIVEPVAANMGVVPPKAGFLSFLRKITEQYHSLLIFDEVITGFRLALGGASEYYRIQPDLATFGKIVGGGMPLAVYGGRKEIMDQVSPMGPVYQAGTLSGNPIATTAGIETLRLLMDDRDIYTRIDQKAHRLEEAFKKQGMHVNRVGSLLSVFFTDKDVFDYSSASTSDFNAFARYFNTMLNHGIYTAPSPYEAMFVSEAHTESDIGKTIAMIQREKLQ